MRDFHKKKSAILFGHPTNTYGTQLEMDCLAAIQKAFPNIEIINPGSEEHRSATEELKEWGDKPMGYLKNLVHDEASMGIFLPFHDGKWATSVHELARTCFGCEHPVYTINAHMEMKKICEINPRYVLSPDQTRGRIEHADGTAISYQY